MPAKHYENFMYAMCCHVDSEVWRLVGLPRYTYEVVLSLSHTHPMNFNDRERMRELEPIPP